MALGDDPDDPLFRAEPGPGSIKDAERFLKSAESIVSWADRRM